MPAEQLGTAIGVLIKLAVKIALLVVVYHFAVKFW